MKKLLMVCAVTLTATISFAQKAKQNTPAKAHSKNTVTYTCPMHPEVQMDKAVHCPKCGMSLTASQKEQLKQKIAKTYHCPMHSEVVSDSAGTCSKCGMNLKASKKEQMKMKQVTGYSCPMHPNEKSNNPGKCSQCGMELTKKN